MKVKYVKSCQSLAPNAAIFIFNHTSAIMNEGSAEDAFQAILKTVEILLAKIVFLVVN